MNRTVTIVVGPDEHGVVQHALLLADVAGTAAVRSLTPQSLAGVPAGLELCHWHFTDRLFGSSIEVAATAFEEAVAAHPALHVATLHDVPAGMSTARDSRRAAGYRRVAAAATAVVVASAHERRRLRRIGVRSPIHVIPLPVRERAEVPPVAPLHDRTVGVLGFVYPGKGHADVIDASIALPPDVSVVALGRASDGHDDLVDELHGLAATAGRTFTTTGYLSDDHLTAALHTTDVPVAPARAASASASVLTWIGAGRRPLAARNGYTTELDCVAPGVVALYGATELTDHLRRALDDPSSTRRAASLPAALTVAAVGVAHRHLYQALLS